MRGGSFSIQYSVCRPMPAFVTVTGLGIRGEYVWVGGLVG